MPTDIPTQQQPDIEKFQRAVASALHKHWKLYLFEGALLAIIELVRVRPNRQPDFNCCLRRGLLAAGRV